MFKRNYEYKGFTICLFDGDWFIYGSIKNKIIGKFDSDIEAENYINREFFLC